ncbi:MAG: AGE family epimerase/isomerase [Dermatophilaceae bacterium]|nr:AGE family epimerase/isomerase [Dermatophilaceae bacterium]
MTWTERESHRQWLFTETLRLLDFGRGAVPTGRGAGWLDDDGVVDGSQPVFTWVTARMAHVYSLGHLLGVPGSREVASRAIDALRTSLHDQEYGGWYASLAPDGTPDTTKSAYAHAFVVLAASTASVAGLDGARDLLDEALGVLDTRFWEPAAGLHADEWDRTWTTLDPYRGVNANMHAVEALLAAGDATGQAGWHERAAVIADRVVARASVNDWRIPEHFDAGWAPRPELNADRPDDPFKPYGATVGHGLEWARLLLQVDAALATQPGRSPGTLVPAARALYEGAVRDGWSVDGAPGFVYTTDWSGAPVVHTRMHWVVAEAIGAAAALHQVSGETRYAQDYARWWDYAAVCLIDRGRGSWHHELDQSNVPGSEVWPGKPDLYHAFQATLLPLLPLAPGLAVAVRDGLAVPGQGGQR